MTTVAAPKKKKETFRIARTVFKANEKQLKVLPDDQWLMAFAKKQYRENSDFKSGVLKIIRPLAVAAASVVGIIAAGITALSLPVVGLSIAGVAATSGILGGLSAKRAIKAFQKDVAPKMQKIIGESFVKSEGEEIKTNFKKRFEENLAARKKQREEEAAANPEPDEPKVVEPKAESPEPKVKDTTPVPEKAPEKKPNDEKTIESGADLAKAAFDFARRRGSKALKNQAKRFRKKKDGNAPK